MNKLVDLRSDTTTKPTMSMREAMKNASVGDDVFGDDPTVKELENLATQIMGKEAALFVPSGTMGNQICVYVQTNRGDEVILQNNHHVFKYELGALGAICGVQSRTLSSFDGCYDPEELKNAIRPAGFQYPKTSLIVMENTHNMAGGMVVPLDHMEAVYKMAHDTGVSVHLDGARIFSAAQYLECSAAQIAAYSDSVMFCLSKGLASPVGSVICGSKEFIHKARRVRKMLGGGMRQVGVLAACGLISLSEMLENVKEDHKKAKSLAQGISSISGLFIDVSKVHSNIVIFEIKDKRMNALALIEKLLKNGIMAVDAGEYKVRFIPTYETTMEDIDYTVKSLGEIFHE